MKYRITLAPAFLYQLGVSYHKTGTMYSTHSKTAFYDYYGVDSLSAAQREAILEWCPDAEIMGAGAEYAPEQRSLLICFPKTGYYRAKVTNSPPMGTTTEKWSMRHDT
jgi:hypothetical protein